MPVDVLDEGAVSGIIHEGTASFDPTPAPKDWECRLRGHDFGWWSPFYDMWFTWEISAFRVCERCRGQQWYVSNGRIDIWSPL